MLAIFSLTWILQRFGDFCSQVMWLIFLDLLFLDRLQLILSKSAELCFDTFLKFILYNPKQISKVNHILYNNQYENIQYKLCINNNNKMLDHIFLNVVIQKFLFVLRSNTAFRDFLSCTIWMDLKVKCQNVKTIQIYGAS